MGRYHVVSTLLPCLAASIARAQTSDTIPPDTSVSAPNYTPKQCNSWAGVLVASNVDASNSLSRDEFYSFLSSIAEPWYVADYFGRYDGFDQLPRVFREVHKSLACHCEKLGFGGECCERDDAEFLLVGFGNSTTAFTSAEDEHKDLFCQQIAHVLAKEIPIPAPTASPLTVLSAVLSALAPLRSWTRSLAEPLPEVDHDNHDDREDREDYEDHEDREDHDDHYDHDNHEVSTKAAAYKKQADGGLGSGLIVVIIISAALGLAVLAIIALVAFHKPREE